VSSKSTTDARETILAAVRRGLDAGPVAKPFPEVDHLTHRAVFGPVGAASLEEGFAEAFIALGGKFVYCAGVQEAADALAELADSRGWADLLCADDAWMAKLVTAGLTTLRPAREGVESSDACITGCEYLVARTGSVVLSSAQPGGRVAPVYYPVHLILARPAQLVEDLGDGITALIEKSGGNLPSLINLNTGPSRTADIEKTLVVGVHGPKEVFVFLVDR